MSVVGGIIMDLATQEAINMQRMLTHERAALDKLLTPQRRQELQLLTDRVLALVLRRPLLATRPNGDAVVDLAIDSYITVCHMIMAGSRYEPAYNVLSSTLTLLYANMPQCVPDELEHQTIQSIRTEFSSAAASA